MLNELTFKKAKTIFVSLIGQITLTLVMIRITDGCVSTSTGLDLTQQENILLFLHVRKLLNPSQSNGRPFVL